jgi:cytochrome c oxidase assembly protein subunit 15
LSSALAFSRSSRLAFTTAGLMFGLIVIGSVVRTTGSGLACPDWPLCHGQLIPPFQFNILIEWFHRLAALLVSLLLFATAASVFASRDVRAALGGLAALALLLLFAQVLLGALTVWKLLHPSVVASHLGVALLLFSTLLVLALAARAHARPELRAELGTRPSGLLPLFALATFLTYGQALLGGMVSTNGAGLACPDWPACNGEWFPAMTGGVGLQVLHRWGAYVLGGVLLLVAICSRTAPDPAVRSAGPAAFGFVLAQVVLGVLNVLMGLPVWLSALHLANAAAILGLLVVLTFRLALAASQPAPVAAEAR